MRLKKKFFFITSAFPQLPRTYKINSATNSQEPLLEKFAQNRPNQREKSQRSKNSFTASLLRLSPIESLTTARVPLTFYHRAVPYRLRRSPVHVRSRCHCCCCCCLIIVWTRFASIVSPCLLLLLLFFRLVSPCLRARESRPFESRGHSVAFATSSSRTSPTTNGRTHATHTTKARKHTDEIPNRPEREEEAKKKWLIRSIEAPAIGSVRGTNTKTARDDETQYNRCFVHCLCAVTAVRIPSHSCRLRSIRAVKPRRNANETKPERDRELENALVCFVCFCWVTLMVCEITDALPRRADRSTRTHTKRMTNKTELVWAWMSERERERARQSETAIAQRQQHRALGNK